MATISSTTPSSEPQPPAVDWFYRHLLRPLLFSRESEQVHDRTLAMLSWASRHPLVCEMMESFYGAPELATEVFGLKFPNPVGLAAGMDKKAVAVPAWSAMGFGFTELGGVTRHSQPGNPAPRMFRAVADEALINRMGFNNPGAESMATTLTQWQNEGRWPQHPVGVNLGKSKITPLEEAAEDYGHSFRVLWNLCDFFVVNVSSPNTPNLRQLQDKAALAEILKALQSINSDLASQKQKRAVSSTSTASTRGSSPKPILVKVAPDLTYEALDEILSLVEPHALAGLVATNTTIQRPDRAEPDLKRIYSETGGLSGRPLRQRSTEVIRHLYQQSNGKIPLIGVGGILTAADAWEKIASGSALIQVYSGLVYQGPQLVCSIVEGLLEQLGHHGLSRIHEAVGSKLPFVTR